jgi:hypothetical protein
MLNFTDSSPNNNRIQYFGSVEPKASNLGIMVHTTVFRFGKGAPHAVSHSNDKCFSKTQDEFLNEGFITFDNKVYILCTFILDDEVAEDTTIGTTSSIADNNGYLVQQNKKRKFY